MSFYNSKASISEINDLELCRQYRSILLGILTTCNTSFCPLPEGSKNIYVIFRIHFRTPAIVNALIVHCSLHIYMEKSTPWHIGG